jgi:serine/threonine protein kinase
MAPEILNGHPYNYKVDMYSFGVSMFEVLNGQVPFIGENK